MQVDEEELRLYYSRLTDEALLAIQRDDLIHAAKTHYDAEIGKRGLKLLVKLNETDSNELLSADEITTPEGPQASAVFFKSLAEAEVACGLVPVRWHSVPSGQTALSSQWFLYSPQGICCNRF